MQLRYALFNIKSNLCKEQILIITGQKMKFSIKNFFSKCDQIHSLLRVWSHLLKKSLMENFIFCAVDIELMETFSTNCAGK